MPGPPPTTTRRTALGGLVAGALLLTGCDRDDLLPPESDPTREPTPEPTGSSAAADPDQALLDTVVEQVDAALLLVTSARTYPVLRQLLRPLQRLHEAHLEVLDAPSDVEAVAQSGGAGRKYLEIRRVETQLARRLADAAVDADSGALARLLASMSAAVAQQLADLPDEVEGR